MIGLGTSAKMNTHLNSLLKPKSRTISFSPNVEIGVLLAAYKTSFEGFFEDLHGKIEMSAPESIKYFILVRRSVINKRLLLPSPRDAELSHDGFTSFLIIETYMVERILMLYQQIANDTNTNPSLYGF